MSVLIVTHAFAERLPQYAVALRVQLSSLLLHVADANIIVCHTDTDERTVRILDEFQPLLDRRLRRLVMTPNSLFRRSIGRNLAALGSHESTVYFADVDYFWGPGCLDALDREMRTTTAAMVWPREVLIHKDHATGDAFWRQYVDFAGPLLPDLTEFTTTKYNRAIGGIQIVRGDHARRHGYLNNEQRWQAPRTDGRPFADFKDDIAYRKFCSLGGGVGAGGGLRAIDLPNVYRMRHSKTTYGGGVQS